jgi:hypothetical protein
VQLDHQRLDSLTLVQLSWAQNKSSRFFAGSKRPAARDPSIGSRNKISAEVVHAYANHFRRLVAQEIRFLGPTKIIVKFFRGQGTFLRCGAGGNFTKI